jgi:hypothetical protein
MAKSNPAASGSGLVSVACRGVVLVTVQSCGSSRGLQRVGARCGVDGIDAVHIGERGTGIRGHLQVHPGKGWLLGLVQLVSIEVVEMRPLIW